MCQRGIKTPPGLTLESQVGFHERNGTRDAEFRCDIASPFHTDAFHAPVTDK